MIIEFLFLHVWLMILSVMFATESALYYSLAVPVLAPLFNTPNVLGCEDRRILTKSLLKLASLAAKC